MTDHAKCDNCGGWTATPWYIDGKAVCCWDCYDELIIKMKEDKEE